MFWRMREPRGRPRIPKVAENSKIPAIAVHLYRERPCIISIKLLKRDLKDAGVNLRKMVPLLLGVLKLNILVPQEMREIVSAHNRHSTLKQPAKIDNKKALIFMEKEPLPPLIYIIV